MRCKIVSFQKLMWRNMTRSTKSQKASVLYYSIDDRLEEIPSSQFKGKLCPNTC